MDRKRMIFTSLLLLAIVMSLAACESYDVEVRNKTDEVMDIYVDEFYEGSVAPDNYLFIRSLSGGEHYIEALDLEEDMVMSDFIYLDGDAKLVIMDKSDYRFY